MGQMHACCGCKFGFGLKVFKVVLFLYLCFRLQLIRDKRNIKRNLVCTSTKFSPSTCLHLGTPEHLVQNNRINMAAILIETSNATAFGTVGRNVSVINSFL